MATKIRLLTSISGSRFCFSRGQEVIEPDEIDPSEAQNLLDAGLAELVEEIAPTNPQKPANSRAPKRAQAAK